MDEVSKLKERLGFTTSLKQFVKANFKYCLIVSSTTNEVSPLCYTQNEVLIPKGCVVILISFNF